MKRLILFYLLIIPNIHLSAQDKIMLEHADHAEYLKVAGEEIITLWGRVKLNSGKMRLEADWVQLNLSQDEFLAKGTVNLISEQGYKIESKEAKYNLKTKQGNMKKPFIFIRPYYCRGYEACVEHGTITFTDASLTTCNLPNPHYCLRTAKVIVCPNDRIVAKNIFFKVGRIPLFYIPSYSRSLKQKKHKIIIRSGKSNVKGNSLGLTYKYLFTPTNIGTLHLSFLQEQGVGKGIEHKYWKNSDLQGKSYFYYIHERKRREDVKSPKRWEISTKHLQKVKDITGILHLQLLSDKDVSRDYIREERYSAGTWEQKNYLAITKTYTNHTFRLVGERIDLWNSKDMDFKKQTTLLPKLTFQTKLTKKNNIYSNLKLEVVNQSNSAANTNYIKGDICINFLNKVKFLSNQVVFSPKIGLLGVIKEKEKASGGLNINLNLRNRIGKYLEINLNHNLKKEFKTDEYHGIQTNALTSTLYMWINKSMRGEITSGIDLRKHKHKSMKITKARLFPLIVDLNLALDDNFVTSLRSTYDFKSSKIEDVESYFDLKKDDWQYGVNVLYRRAYSHLDDDILDIYNYVAFKLSPKTHIRGYIYYDLKNRRIKESGLIINKDLHCWNSKFSIRHGKETEIWLNLNIK
jgi:lipopolysaccharide assembly outer membrane protein LptD (OstA)